MDHDRNKHDGEQMIGYVSNLIPKYFRWVPLCYLKNISATHADTMKLQWLEQLLLIAVLLNI